MRSGLMMLAAAILLPLTSLYAQWKEIDMFHAPEAGLDIPHVSVAYEGGDVHVFTQDTAYHFYSYSLATGWVHHAEAEALLDTIYTIYDTKTRNGHLWCLSSQGLIHYSSAGLELIPYPLQHAAGTNGLYIDENNGVWFPGGFSGRGITHYSAPGNWTHISKATHPGFGQDMGITDLKMDETDSVIWIAANCFGDSSGVYSFDLKTSHIKYHLTEAKYRCVHAVAPVNDQVFVGTANFSSVRIMTKSGQYLENLNFPKVRWVAEMRSDPEDHDRVWVLTDYGVMHFKDSDEYYIQDTANTLLRGYGNEISLERVSEDSARLWVATSAGLYHYTYKTNVSSGVGEREKKRFRFSLYPNPSAGTCQVRLPAAGDVTVKVFDITGRQVHQTINDGEQQFELSLGTIPAGMYTVFLSDGNKTSAQKLVLTR